MGCYGRPPPPRKGRKRLWLPCGHFWSVIRTHRNRPRTAMVTSRTGSVGLYRRPPPPPPGGRGVGDGERSLATVAPSLECPKYTPHQVLDYHGSRLEQVLRVSDGKESRSPDGPHLPLMFCVCTGERSKFSAGQLILTQSIGFHP